MKTPRNLKQALEQNYFVCKIYNKGGKRIRVTLQERQHISDRETFVEFWIDSKYFERNYRDIYERF